MSWLGILIRRRAKRDPRTIFGPAVRFYGLGVIAFPPPATHDYIFDVIARRYVDRRNRPHGQPGFVTANGRFVLPREALVLARLAGQISAKGAGETELRCSDLPVITAAADQASLTPPSKRGRWATARSSYIRWFYARRGRR